MLSHITDDDTSRSGSALLSMWSVVVFCNKKNQNFNYTFREGMNWQKNL